MRSGLRTAAIVFCLCLEHGLPAVPPLIRPFMPRLPERLRRDTTRRLLEGGMVGASPADEVRIASWITALSVALMCLVAREFPAPASRAR